MKRNLTMLIVALFALQSTVYSQDSEVKIKAGPTLKLTAPINEMLGQIGDLIYFTSNTKGPRLGAVRSNDLSQAFEIVLKRPKYQGQPTTFRGVTILDDKLIMICEQYNKDKDSHTLLAQRLDENGNNEDLPIVLDVIEPESKGNSRAESWSLGASPVGFYSRFSWYVDSEKGRLLLYTDMPFKKHGNEKFRFKVFNKNTEVVWEEELELPYPDAHFRISDYMIDKDDKLFMLCSFNEFEKTKEDEGKEKAKEEAKDRGGNYYTYRVLIFDPKTSKLIDCDVQLQKGQAIVSIDYNLDLNGDLNVVGLYANDEKSDGAHGVYFVKIDAKTGETKTTSIKEFDQKMIEEYLVATKGERRGEKSANEGAGISNFKVDHIINRTDGGLLICGEIFRWYITCSGSSCTSHDIYGYIITVNISPNGDFEWIRYVPKIQHTVNNEGIYSSYAFIVSGEKLYYIFNDDIRNYSPNRKPTIQYSMTKPKESVTTIATMDSDGAISMVPNAQLRIDDKLLRPSGGRYIEAENKMIFLAKWKKAECFVELRIED